MMMRRKTTGIASSGTKCGSHGRGQTNGVLRIPMINYILKTLVGSKAHELDTPASDIDLRGVFIHPTKDFFMVGRGKPVETVWIEGDQDDTAYELNHFLHLATHSNPTVLEVFKGPVVEQNMYGSMLRDLFPHVWSTEGVYNAFRGYGRNQMNKMRANDPKMGKFGVAWVRTLINAISLLTEGDFEMRVQDEGIRKMLMRWRVNEGVMLYEPHDTRLRPIEVITVAYQYEEELEKVYPKAEKRVPDFDRINEYIEYVRSHNW